jgi:hypothetical protein
MAVVSQSTNRAWIEPPGADIRAALGCQTEIDADETEASFEFVDPDDQQPNQIDLSPAQRAQFRTAFRRDRLSIAAWSRNVGWTPAVAPDLKVIIANSFKTSRALLPAWEGQHGRMEFPTWRVAAGKAAITHELVHVYYPNGNRFLAEGFAIYVQALIGGNPAFPNFGRPLHAHAFDVVCDLLPEFVHGRVETLAALRVADLEPIGTPDPLALEVGTKSCGVEPYGQARLYPIAGSFTEFLIDTYGLCKFRELYDCTPLLPSEKNPGNVGRWMDVYKRPFDEFETEWKVMIARQQPQRS